MKALSTLFALVLTSTALAQPADPTEAGKRFSAGVALYNEADYRSALVEFKRAYELAPNPTVLYNIGQTHFQLQEYAAAYTVLGRYIAEAGETAEHRTEVLATLQTLQSRIGKIDIIADAGAEVTIDEEPPLKTPFKAPVLVSIGRHRVTVTAAGKLPQTRFIDVAAGDTIRQEVVLQAPAAPVVTVKPTPTPAQPRDDSSSLVPALWATGGVLAVGSITFGILAYRASNKLDDLRDNYPVERSALTSQADRVARYSYLADGFGIVAIVAGGAALTLTLLRDDKTEKKPTVGVGPGGIVVAGSF